MSDDLRDPATFLEWLARNTHERTIGSAIVRGMGAPTIRRLLLECAEHLRSTDSAVPTTTNKE